MNGLEDTYFSGYSRLKEELHHTGKTNSNEQDDSFGFEHFTASKPDTDIPVNNFGGFGKARYSDRFGKSPDYFTFGYKKNKPDDVFTALSSEDLAQVSTQQNLTKYSGNDFSAGGHASYLNNEASMATGKEASVNTFGMDSGGFKSPFFQRR